MRWLGRQIDDAGIVLQGFDRAYPEFLYLVLFQDRFDFLFTGLKTVVSVGAPVYQLENPESSVPRSNNPTGFAYGQIIQGIPPGFWYLFPIQVTQLPWIAKRFRQIGKSLGNHGFKGFSLFQIGQDLYQTAQHTTAQHRAIANSYHPFPNG